ncbi:MAG TPA: hypothetical protein VK154_18445 [Chitinophagales bacterium]|nr:hypothetical protein [Chitinophagales bacterium]
MKTLLLVCIYLLFTTPDVFAQSTETRIKEINQLTAHISNNLADYDTVTADIWGESTEGGHAIAYYDGKQMVHIKTTHYGETGKTDTEYFFDKGQLVLAVRKEEHYNRPMYYDKKRAEEDGDTEFFDPSKSITETTTYFFTSEKLILLLDKNNKEVASATAGNSIAGADHIEQAHKLKKLLAKK